MPEYDVVGKPLPRIDGVVKVTGTAIYAEDLSLPGMLHGKLLRSPYAHAKIHKIDTSKAERLPGVKAVITGKDFPGIPVGFMREYSDRPPIAIDKVRHYGEAVAAVAAISEDIAEEALDLIEVEYQELPVVLTWEEAMKEGAPVIHDRAPNNVSASLKYEYGDVEKAFKECDYIRETKLVSHRVGVGFIEPHCALASVDASGKVLFQGSKQSPYITWRHLCAGLDMPLHQIRMVNPYVGGGFSGKHDAHDLDFCTVRLAQKTGRPVKIVVTQDEIIGTYRQRHEKNIWLKMGMKKDGTIVAADCKLIAEGGAYLGVGPLNMFLFGMFLGLPFRLPNLKFEAYRVYTNKPICGAVKGQAAAIATYVMSSMVSMMADDLRLDPAEVMLKNLVKEGEVLANGSRVTTNGLEEAVRKVTKAVGWKEKRAKRIPNRGLGLGCGAMVSGVRLGGHFAGAAVIKVVENGTINLIHGGTELGQGCDTVLAQMAAEVLGLRLEDVHIEMEDTNDTILDAGLFSDKCTVWTGNAVKAAAEEVKRKLAKVAAQMLGAREDEIVFKDRKVYVKDNPEKQLPFRRVVLNAQYGLGQCIYGSGSWAPPGIEIPDFHKGYGRSTTPSFSFMANAVEVEVDPETGKVKLLSSVVAEDCGQPINPMLVEGQDDGGVAQMTGHGLFEECLVNEKGQPLNSSLRDYKMPTAMDLPKLVNYHVITHDPVGPFGAKGAGETSTCSTLAALSNAIDNAVGIRITDLPITPHKILKALKEKKEGK